MSIDFSLGTPFASALQAIVQPKLAEYGWTTGDPEDSTIFEYILLMLGNHKNETQIASELSNDLLDLGPDNPETQQFAQWLFEQIHQLAAGNAEPQQANESHMVDSSNDVPSAPQDTDMDGNSDVSPGNIPTGPKAMRNGSGNSAKTPRGGGRMLNNLNRQMGRTDDSPLHRVRGAQGTGRIGSHSREPPKGPRSDNLGRGIAAMANGRGAGNVAMAMPPGGMPMGGMGMSPMGVVGGMPGMPMPPMGQNGMPNILNAQQQMALMQMYEQQAQMMQQIFSGGGTPTPFVNPNFQQNNRKNGRPSFNDRRQGNKQTLPPSAKFTKKDGDDAMIDSAGAVENGGDTAMDIESGRGEPFDTVCKFNLRCSKPDCPFAHQSPAAPEGTPLDFQNTCTFGAKCTNKKCVGRHPSPAQRHVFQAEQDCVFFPNCRDMANCPYRHPNKPACRNGADCVTPGCIFWHNTVACKFNPCTNKHCPFKHVEGQKKQYKDRVWVAGQNGEEKKDHVSERKFVDDEAVEELIIPGKSEESKSQEEDVNM